MANMMDEERLKGALAAIERRARPEMSINEFRAVEPLVDFKATRTALPAPLPTSERRTLLEIRIGASYAVFRGDDEEICRRAEENAMRALCRCLYEDVLDDLVPIMRAVGDGKRVEALRLLDRLYTHLNGA